MKYITKIGLVIGLIGCIAGLILCAINHIDFGTWGIVAFVAGIMFFGILLSWRPILTFLTNNFNIEYTKEGGLKITEDKDQQNTKGV